MSFDVPLNWKKGQALQSHICELRIVGLRWIFLSLSSVDAEGARCLIETLDYDAVPCGWRSSA
jgi:hypothetical protein